MPRVDDFVRDLPALVPGLGAMTPWVAARDIADVLGGILDTLPDEFERRGDVAVHRSAVVHESGVLTGPTVVDAGAAVGPHVRIREGVYVGPAATIGASTEVKSSWVMAGAALAHLDYVGNSVVGDAVNVEAGAVLANHFNERDDKQISVVVDGHLLDTGCTKFGAMVGSGSRIGANAVTSPGTLLAPGTIVGRLELVDQCAALR